MTNPTTAPIPRIFVVNLPADVERRRFMEAQLEQFKLPFVFQEAVRGKSLSGGELAASYDKDKALHFKRRRLPGRELTLAEIGCALSHVAIYKKMLAENMECALILEDDALLGGDVPEILSRLAKKIDFQKPDIILLSVVANYSRWGRRPFAGKYHFVSPYSKRPWWRSHGYFITRAAAGTLARELFPVWSVADDWLTFSENFNIRLSAIVPYCVGISDHGKNSSLETERKTALSKLKTRRSLLFYIHDCLWNRIVHRLLIFPVFAKKQKETW